MQVFASCTRAGTKQSLAGKRPSELGKNKRLWQNRPAKSEISAIGEISTLILSSFYFFGFGVFGQSNTMAHGSHDKIAAFTLH